MPTKIRFSISILSVFFLLLMTAAAAAQGSAEVCPAFVQQSHLAASFVCKEVADGQACIGSGQVRSQAAAGAALEFGSVGNVAALAGIRRMDLQTLNSDSQSWSLVLARLETVAADGAPQTVGMTAFGDVSLSQASSATPGVAAFRLESLPISAGCAETPDSGLLLQSATLEDRARVEVNGAALEIGGTVYLSAQIDDRLAVYALEGETRLSVDGAVVDLSAGDFSEVALNVFLGPSGDPSPAAPYSPEQAARFAFMPLRLLSRPLDMMADSADESPADAPAMSTPPDFSCEPKTCSEISSCQEALHQLNVCENRSLDGDGDGVPCESICSDSPADAPAESPAEPLASQCAPLAVADRILDADTSSGAAAQAVLLFLGEVAWQEVDSAPAPADSPAEAESAESAADAGAAAEIQSAVSISLRARPRVDTDTIAQLEGDAAVRALGRSLDQQWVQVQTEDGTIGWVFVQLISIAGGADILPIVDPDAAPLTAPIAPAAVETAAQELTFSSAVADSGCLAAGLVVQSPADMEGRLRLKINGVDFEIAGTVYLNAYENERMNIFGLEGAASVSVAGNRAALTAGQQTIVLLANGLSPAAPPEAASAYSAEQAGRFDGLPIEQLPRSFALPAPREAEAPAGALDSEATPTPETADLAGTPEPPPPAAPAPTATPAPPAINDAGAVRIGGTWVKFDAYCTMRSGGTARNMRNGPGLEFPVRDVLQVGQSVQGITQKRGSDGLHWYETARGWIRQDAGVPTADCTFLPVHGIIYDTTMDSGASVERVEVIEQSIIRPTATRLPPLLSDAYGDICPAGLVASGQIQGSGNKFYEFGVWTGHPGTTATFVGETPFFHPAMGDDIIALVGENGSAWLGSGETRAITVRFDATRRFRVRVSGLLGDYVGLQVICG